MTCEFNQYQKFVREKTLPTANNIEYGIHNLTSEAGEVASVRAKEIRDGEQINTLDKYIKELGDTIFMVAHVCNQLGITLDDVVSTNITKLNKRAEDGTLQGSGDER